jgi:hypothetical protein
MTLHECLNMYIEILGVKWDRWDYEIYAPMSLRDDAALIVVLRNEKGRSVEVKIPLSLP